MFCYCVLFVYRTNHVYVVVYWQSIEQNMFEIMKSKKSCFKICLWSRRRFWKTVQLRYHIRWVGIKISCILISRRWNTRAQHSRYLHMSWRIKNITQSLLWFRAYYFRCCVIWFKTRATWVETSRLESVCISTLL